MRRISILACVLGASFVSTAWAQQAVTKSALGRHFAHRMANQASKTPDLTASRSFVAQADPEHGAKVWELGTYPGGTWFASWHLNDLGVIVGRGDVPPDGYTHTLVVPLSGPDAGKWIDLGTLGGEQPKGWEEPLADISNTGLIVSKSTAPGGREHGFAWTEETGMVDLGTLADTGDPQYASYNSSFATGTNNLGTLIVGQGWSVELDKGLPVVWTPSFKWKDGKFVTEWKIQALDLSAFPELTRGVAWEVNDYGQIIGTGINEDVTIFTALLWNPRPNGKGWDLTSLPPSPLYPLTQAYGINDRGEIVGVANSADFSIWLPRLWQPLDEKRTTYSQPIELPLPKGGFTSCEGVGINDLDDMVGDCWGNMKDLPTRWTTKDLTFAEIIKFPGTWGFSWGVNNNRIAALTCWGGENCAANRYGSCGSAIQLH